MGSSRCWHFGQNAAWAYPAPIDAKRQACQFAFYRLESGRHAGYMPEQAGERFIVAKMAEKMAEKKRRGRKTSPVQPETRTCHGMVKATSGWTRGLEKPADGNSSSSGTCISARKPPASCPLVHQGRGGGAGLQGGSPGRKGAGDAGGPGEAHSGKDLNGKACSWKAQGRCGGGRARSGCRAGTHNAASLHSRV